MMQGMPVQAVYIAGPMTGYEHYNVTAFEEAAARWRAVGHDPVTPFESNSVVWRRHFGRDFDPRTDKCDYGDKLLAELVAEDIGTLCRADAIVLLHGWEKSRGARVELHMALNLGKPIYDADDPYMAAPLEFAASFTVVDKKESALQEAHRLVHGARQGAYGHPIDDYTRTGRMWGAILGIGDIDPRVCCLMMAAVKISREVHSPKRDNRVDLAGYAECAELVAVRQIEDAAA